MPVCTRTLIIHIKRSSFIFARILLEIFLEIYVYKYVFTSPHTPKSTKINLSNTYISPSQNNILKSKVFISPNRYALLNTDENDDITTPYTNSTTEDLNCSPHKDHNVEQLAPPIHKNIFNSSTINLKKRFK